jgi:hypothetical protein
VQVIARGKFPCYQPFNLSQFGHGCQMVYFQTKRPNLGKLWRALDCKMLLYFWPFGIFYGHLRYFITIWCILCSFGTFFPVLVSCTKKNLATLSSETLKLKEEKKSKKSQLSNFPQFV